MFHKNFLVGPHLQFPGVTISLLTGVSPYAGQHKDNFVTNGSFFTQPDYTLNKFDNYSTPVELNFCLGGRFLGVGLSIILNVNDEPAASGLKVGIPFGLLRG